MNATRRKELQPIIDKLEELKLELEYIKDEEGGAYDNLPESLQESEMGQRISECFDNLESAYDSIDEAITSITEAIEL